ncbi:hypothetical protein CU044_6990 [Streptomyces sp. L-9-10]|nr:hypothetical protein CU044_6990 [Streptomyces sp. L-9-10]
MKNARAYLFSMAFPRFGGPRGPDGHRLGPVRWVSVGLRTGPGPS